MYPEEVVFEVMLDLVKVVINNYHHIYEKKKKNFQEQLLYYLISDNSGSHFPWPNVE